MKQYLVDCIAKKIVVGNCIEISAEVDFRKHEYYREVGYQIIVGMDYVQDHNVYFIFDPNQQELSRVDLEVILASAMC